MKDLKSIREGLTVTMSLCFGADAEMHYFENETEHIKNYTSPLEHFLYKVFS